MHAVTLACVLASPEVPSPRVYVAGEGIRTLDPFSDSPSASASSSYNASEIAGSSAAESRRLLAQMRLTWEKELRLFRWHGLADGMRVCEFGCGPGWSTLRLARALPASSVVCAEPSPPFVDAARSLLQGAGVPPSRARVELGALPAVGWASGTCDFAIARFVLQHVASPRAALAEVYRTLSPGGVLGVVESDDMMGGLMDPLLPALHKPILALGVRQAARGGSRFVGRHAARLLRAAGFEKVEVDAVVASSDSDANDSGASHAAGDDAGEEAGEGAPSGLQGLAASVDVGRFASLVVDGLLREEELRAAEESASALLAEPTSLVLTLSLVTLGTRPARGAGDDAPRHRDELRQ